MASPPEYLERSSASTFFSRSSNRNRGFEGGLGYGVPGGANRGVVVSNGAKTPDSSTVPHPYTVRVVAINLKACEIETQNLQKCSKTCKYGRNRGCFGNRGCSVHGKCFV